MSDEGGKGFEVRDRRRFTDAGEARDDAEKPEPTEEPKETVSPSEPSSEAEVPPITFGTFLVGLSTQALACLGEIPNPIDGERRTDLLGARELIDILSLLQAKTRGNLEKDEEELLENVLFDLRLRYVRRKRESRETASRDADS